MFVTTPAGLSVQDAGKSIAVANFYGNANGVCGYAYYLDAINKSTVKQMFHRAFCATPGALGGCISKNVRSHGKNRKFGREMCPDSSRMHCNQSISWPVPFGPPQRCFPFQNQRGRAQKQGSPLRRHPAVPFVRARDRGNQAAAAHHSIRQEGFPSCRFFPRDR